MSSAEGLRKAKELFDWLDTPEGKAHTKAKEEAFREYWKDFWTKTEEGL